MLKNYFENIKNYSNESIKFLDFCKNERVHKDFKNFNHSGKRILNAYLRGDYKYAEEYLKKLKEINLLTLVKVELSVKDKYKEKFKKEPTEKELLQTYNEYQQAYYNVENLQQADIVKTIFKKALVNEKIKTKEYKLN